MGKERYKFFFGMFLTQKQIIQKDDKNRKLIHVTKQQKKMCFIIKEGTPKWDYK